MKLPLFAAAIAACALTAPGTLGALQLADATHAHVIADDTGSPLANACVVIEAGPEGPCTATDSTGFFTIIAPHDNRRALLISKSGYATTRVLARDVQQEVRLPRGAVITGHVMDDISGPIAMTSVVAERRTVTNGHVAFERLEWVETDDTGAYRLFDLPAGEYVVGLAGGRLIAASGGTAIPFGRLVVDYYPHTTEADAADVIALRPGVEVTGIDFSLRLPAPGPAPAAQSPAAPGRTGTIRGRVLRADGLPSRTARVELSSAERLFSPFNTTTDADGRYEFSGLKPGRYLVAATDSTSMTKARFGQRNTSDRGDVVTVTAGSEVGGIDISLVQPGVITGRVTDEYGDAVANANVRIQQIVWRGGRRRLAAVPGVTSRETDDRGRYRLFGVAPGRYLVSAGVGEDLRGRLAGINHLPGYVRTYVPGTPVASEAQVLDVATGDQLFDNNIALSRASLGRITGRVLTSDGEPFRGSVYAIPSARSGAVANEAAATQRTSDGRFDFDRLPAGEYVIQAASGWKSKSHEGEFATSLAVARPRAIIGLSMRMSAGSSIAGHVTFDGEPPATNDGIELSAVPGDADFISLADNPVARAEVGDDGSFELLGLQGPRRIVLTRAPEGWTVKSIAVGGLDVTDEAIAFGGLDASTSTVEVTLTRDASEIAGAVSRENGEVVPDVDVVAFAADRGRWYAHSRFVSNAKTSADGRFSVRGLPSGSYYVAAIDPRDAADLADQLSNPEFLTTLSAGAARITLEKDRARIDLRLPRRR